VDTDLIEIIGESKAKISSMEERLQNIEKDQKVILEFIAEQKVGKRFIWAFLAVVGTIFAVLNDFISAIPKLFSAKGLN
jgi:hypothetical protein